METNEQGPVMRVTSARRQRFLSGRVIADALPKARDSKVQATYLEKPERIHPKGGNYKPSKKKLTGAIPLKVRKQMLAEKLRKAGAKTAAGLFGIRRDAVCRAAKLTKIPRSVKRAEKQAAIAARREQGTVAA